MRLQTVKFLQFVLFYNLDLYGLQPTPYFYLGTFIPKVKRGCIKKFEQSHAILYHLPINYIFQFIMSHHVNEAMDTNTIYILIWLTATLLKLMWSISWGVWDKLKFNFNKIV